MMVDAVVWGWLRQTFCNKVVRLGVGEYMRRFLVSFYVDDGLVQARCPTFLQFAFDISVNLSERVRLYMNTAKNWDDDLCSGED